MLKTKWRLEIVDATTTIFTIKTYLRDHEPSEPREE